MICKFPNPVLSSLTFPHQRTFAMYKYSTQHLVYSEEETSETENDSDDDDIAKKRSNSKKDRNPKARKRSKSQGSDIISRE